MPHILVVEDDKMNATLFEVILRRRGGFTVTVTEDPLQVIDLARKKSIDLVIMDVSLSNSFLNGKAVDGLEISRVLKQDPVTKHIPILLATAHSMQGVREKFLAESKADDYISKPITDQKQLIERVKHYLPPA